MAVDRALKSTFEAYVSVGVVGILSKWTVSDRAFVVAGVVVHRTKRRLGNPLG